MPAAQIYKLTKNDWDIYHASETNPNIFTEWYFRSPLSGTFYNPDSPRPQISVPYDKLYEQWMDLGQPKEFEFDTERYGIDPVRVIHNAMGKPIFHTLHGFRLLPWQEDLWCSDKMTDVAVGGFGSGKTLVATIRSARNAAFLPGYRGFFLAPHLDQAKELKKKLVDLARNTRFDRQFIKTATDKPPRVVIWNDHVGETTLECIPILDDPEKIKNLEGDEAVIDQFEDLMIDNDFKANVVSRLRGYDVMSGREKLGKVTWVGNANSDDPGFLDLTEEARTDKVNYGYFQPDSRDNIYTSDRQIANWRVQFVKTAEDEEMYFKGIPQMGKGRYFPATSIARCKSQGLDDYMEHGLLNELPGFVRQSANNVGTWLWETPYVEGGRYVVLADPGWDNPPGRNAPCIMAWRVDQFPLIPARLAAFAWIPAQGSPDPWVNKFLDYVVTYKAIGNAFYDATGPQKGYERYYPKLSLLGATPCNLGNGEKDANLTGLRTLLSNGLLNFPAIINGLRAQLLKYELPDKNLSQDIVMALHLISISLSPLLITEDVPEAENPPLPRDRHFRNARKPRHRGHRR